MSFQPYLVKFLLLLFQIGYQLPLVVQVHDQVIQLLLEPVLGFLQFVIGSRLLLILLAEALISFCNLFFPSSMTSMVLAKSCSFFLESESWNGQEWQPET